MSYTAINEARRRQQDNETADRINAEARAANEIQAQTGCTRTEALLAAKRAFDQCLARVHHRERKPFPCGPAVTEGEVVVLCTTDPVFIEHWTNPGAARDRCDELNRNLEHPAYFIA